MRKENLRDMSSLWREFLLVRLRKKAFKKENRFIESITKNLDSNSYTNYINQNIRNMVKFKAIVTLNDGGHKILRMTKEMVASFVYAFRMMQQDFLRVHLWNYVGSEYLIMNGVVSCKFIFENNGQEYLTIE